MREESPPIGWVACKHTPTGGVVYRPGELEPAPIRRVGVKHSPAIDWSAADDKFKSALADSDLPGLASSLGIASDFLVTMRVGWSPGHGAWTFPMHDADERITGYRLRFPDGKKMSIRGSRDGVFLPYFDSHDPVVVTEGPTDAAALLSLGYWVIGRPSCHGGVAIIQSIAKGHDVVIISDRDSPGRQGADALRGALSGIVQSVRVVEPTGSASDAREWVTAGVSREAVDAVINQAVPA